LCNVRLGERGGFDLHLDMADLTLREVAWHDREPWVR
jgi:hypothetical protein